jgi:hypothetical protein
MKSFASTAFISLCLLLVCGLGQSPNNILHGEVTQDGHPVAGAVVSIYLLTPQGYAKTIVSNTNTDGGYFFATIPKGDYAVLINNGDTRLYQGMITIGDRLDNVRNVTLSTKSQPSKASRSRPVQVAAAGPSRPAPAAPPRDLVSGKWKLNLALSKIPSWMHITDEIRTYLRNGDVVKVSVERLHQDNSKITYQREIACDGKSVMIEKQMVSCEFKAPNFIEEQTSPPIQYSTTEVLDGKLIIGVFHETRRVKPDEKYVFDRIK